MPLSSLSRLHALISYGILLSVVIRDPDSPWTKRPSLVRKARFVAPWLRTTKDAVRVTHLSVQRLVLAPRRRQVTAARQKDLPLPARRLQRVPLPKSCAFQDAAF